MDTILQNAGCKYDTSIEATLGTTICSLVAEGLGIAVIDPFTAAHAHDPRVARRPFRPRIPYECAMVVPSYRPRAKIVENFTASLREGIAQDLLHPPPARQRRGSRRES